MLRAFWTMVAPFAMLFHRTVANGVQEIWYRVRLPWDGMVAY